MFSWLFGKRKRSEPRPSNLFKNKIEKAWPSGPGGFWARGTTSKTYKAKYIENSKGVPLKISYGNLKPKNFTAYPSNNKTIVPLSSLAPGTYLYLIEYDRETREYITKFLKTSGHIEINARHYLLANLSNPIRKVVVAAGELQKNSSGKIVFNLESGTFMFPGLLSWYRNRVGGNFNKNYPEFVKNVLDPSATFTKRILLEKENITPQQIINKTKKLGLVPLGYVSKLKGAPVLSYEEWMKEINRRTRSKGPVNPKLQLRNRPKRIKYY
jgi:hypothetical protein